MYYMSESGPKEIQIPFLRLRTKFTTGGFKNAFRKAEDDIKREPLSEAEEEESEEIVPRIRRSRHDSDSPPPVRR